MLLESCIELKTCLALPPSGPFVVGVCARGVGFLPGCFQSQQHATLKRHATLLRLDAGSHLIMTPKTATTVRRQRQKERRLTTQERADVVKISWYGLHACLFIAKSRKKWQADMMEEWPDVWAGCYSRLRRTCVGIVRLVPFPSCSQPIFINSTSPSLTADQPLEPRLSSACISLFGAAPP